MKKVIALAIAILLAHSYSIAQNDLGSADNRVIDVTGTAEKSVVPVEIYISITLKAKGDNTVEKQEEELKNALRALSIPADNLSLSDANANYVRVKWSRKEVVSKTEYLLKVGDAKTVGMVFEELDKLKINDANISRVDHSQIEKFKKEVKVMAMKAAKEKATYLLEAIGEKVGKAQYVQEMNVYASPRAVNLLESNVAAPYAIDAFKTGFPGKVIQFQKIVVKASMRAKFDIE